MRQNSPNVQKKKNLFVLPNPIQIPELLNIAKNNSVQFPTNNSYNPRINHAGGLAREKATRNPGTKGARTRYVLNLPLRCRIQVGKKNSRKLAIPAEKRLKKY